MKKNFKLIICGVIVLLLGTLMFFDKIAETVKLDTTQMPFSIVNSVSNPVVGIRKSITHEDEIKNLQNDLNDTNAKLDKSNNEVKKAKGSASNYDYFTVEVVNMPVTAGINNIAIISASYFTDIPSSDEVVFKSGVDWTNKLGVATKSFGKRVKELSSLDYNNYPKNKWKTIGK